MKRHTGWGLAIALFLIAATVSPGITYAQGPAARFFPETGHWVSGQFLEYYESTPNPLLVYGFPITEEIDSPNNPNLRVQYFEQARFELHPENPPELRVVLSNLGERLYEIEPPGQVKQVPENSAACRIFPETDHPVCYSFLKFFDAHGGIAQFGYPISELEVQKGMLVQYFQRARFEWHPELQAGKRVQLTDIGTFYFLYYKEDARDLLPQSAAPSSIVDLHVRAFVDKAVAQPETTQILYVIVQDQNLNPIQNAQVTFTVRLPSGEESRYIMELTNEYGYTYEVFTVQGQPNGIAQVFVEATYTLYQKQTRASYRIWW